MSELVECPATTGSLEGRPGAVVREAPEAGVGALVGTCGHLVGSSVGDEDRSSAAAGEVSGQQPGGTGCPDDYLAVAAFAGDGGSFSGQVKVLDIEGEDLVGPRGGFVQHPPQCLFPQADIGSCPESAEVVVGDCFRLIPRYAFAFDGGGVGLVEGRGGLRVASGPVPDGVDDGFAV